MVADAAIRGDSSSPRPPAHNPIQIAGARYRQIGAESLPSAGRLLARRSTCYATVNVVGAHSSLAGSTELTRSDRRQKAVTPCDDPELSWPRPW
jgi:hypothetical protein